jgi:hypothetical protein
MTPADNYHWSSLNHLQMGRYAEYHVAMEFTRHPAVSVFTAEVDDRGIDMVIRIAPDGHPEAARYYDVQVKSIRRAGYVFFPKKVFMPRDNLLAAVVVFVDGRLPDLFLIPSRAWTDTANAGVLVERDYGGDLKSKPEWGINVSRVNMPRLARYEFHGALHNLVGC